MNYEEKYLKYKSKYFELKADLESKGYNVDELLKSMEVNQNGGGDAQTSEIFLGDTPTNDQQGGDYEYSPSRAGVDGAPPIPSRLTDTETGKIVSSDKAYTIKTPPQSNTTSTVKNVYNYFDPLYPTYNIPGYNTVYTPNPVFTVPTNPFKILKPNNVYVDLYDDLDDDLYDVKPRRRKSSRRKSKRASRKSSKRKSSRRKSRRSSRKSSRRK